ncbi:coiled-coil domain-containing protein 86-like [Phalacrocorax carbo]|uniref:coiled-coil domain-containing protein 86-like n=1 Tax=Phalacrocorax carbo TaxID=9209 RepID=UPI00311A547B
MAECGSYKATNALTLAALSPPCPQQEGQLCLLPMPPIPTGPAPVPTQGHWKSQEEWRSHRETKPSAEPSPLSNLQKGDHPPAVSSPSRILWVLGAERRSRAAAVWPVDEEVSSDSEPESPSLGRRWRRELAVEEEMEETPQEKKLRLAKLYLEELRQHEEERAAAEEEEEETHPADLIGDRLKEDVLEQKGRLQRLVAKDVQPPDPASIRVLRGHQLPVTCLVISPDDRFIFSASKDGSLIKCKCSLGAATGCSPSLNPAGRDPAAAGAWVPVEVAGPLPLPGMCTCIVLGSVGGSLALSNMLGGSQGVTAMPFP